ncbi:L-asparaginase [Xylariales sp. PMI_506]|nr:L-asparaginase [Xylariales sp. PMI_506]
MGINSTGGNERAPVYGSLVPCFSATADTVCKARLPGITIFGTGGTIAGSASSNTQTTGYKPGAIDIQVLIDAVPAISDIAVVNGVQVSNIRSTEITSPILLDLSRRITAALKSDECQGVVVTHGTDTLEETAFFLSVTVRSPKPVVLVGAIRPATAISADGPINLLQATTLAASKAAMGRGPLVVLNDRISSAYYTTKGSTNALDAFRATEQGHLGYFDNTKPKFYYTPALPIGLPYFDISDTADLPQVDIIYGHQGLNPNIITQVAKDGARGIVLATMGNGGWTLAGMEAVRKVIQDGIYVIHSHRCQDGVVSPAADISISSGLLSPERSRIMLQLALDAGYTLDQTKSLFEM